EMKYERFYGVVPGNTVAGSAFSEICVDAVGKVGKPRLIASRKRKSDIKAARKGKRQVFFTRTDRGFIDTPVYDYGRLGTGARIKGPAVIELPFTTTLVPPEHRITVDSYRNLVMEVR